MFFEKVMTKTDLPYSTAGDMRPAGDGPITRHRRFQKLRARRAVRQSS
jgi:hypothetical protein